MKLKYSPDLIWESVLAVKKHIYESIVEQPSSFSVIFIDGEFSIASGQIKQDNGFVVHLEKFSLNNFIETNDCIEFFGVCSLKKNKDFLSLYLPYCILPVIAHQQKRSITVTHFAQTLDGKIASYTGDSKWIGNQENLIHAHRMRALCDGIMVGKQTVISDSPSLNVRLVAGENPVKIILGNPDKALKKSQKGTSAMYEIYAGSKEFKNCFDQNLLNCEAFLKSMYQKNIYSIFVEGGMKTSSTFVSQAKADVVQLHIAPIVLGSGISTFELDKIESISQAIKFKTFQFTKVGKEIMFVGI